MNIASTKRVWSTLFVCLVVGLGLTVSSCDTGGANSSSSTSSESIDPSSVGDKTTVEVKSSSSSSTTKGLSKASGGVVTVTFFYETNDGPCTKAKSKQIVPTSEGAEKTFSLTPPSCATGGKTGVSISYVSLGSSSSGVTLTVRSNGQKVASSSSEDGDVTVEGGTVPSSGSSSDQTYPWTGSWELTSINGSGPDRTTAFKLTPRGLTLISTASSDCSGADFDRIVDASNSQITFLEESDGPIEEVTYNVNTSSGTLTITEQGGDETTIKAESINEDPLSFVECTINDNDDGGGGNGADPVLAGPITVELAGNGSSALLSKASGTLGVLFSYAPESGGSVCADQTSAAVSSTPVTKAFDPAGVVSECDNPSDFDGVSVGFAPGSGSSASGLTLTILNEDGEVIASDTDPSNGLSVSAGELPDRIDPSNNQPPTVDLRVGGSSTVTTGDFVSLIGSFSDPDGDNLNFSWSLSTPDGSNASLNGTSTPEPNFTPNVAGDYTVTLEVTDGSVTVTKSVTVTAISGSDDGGGGANVPSSLTGKWKITSTTQSDVDLSTTDIFWEITSSQIGITIEGMTQQGTFCTTDTPESIVSVDGNTITTDDGDGDAPAEATFDITNGGDKLTVEGINGATVEATRVSSIPECS